MTPQSPATQGTTMAVEAALQQAIAAHQAGQLPQAEAAYRAILAAQPSHPDANHNLGVLAVQVGQVAAALPLFKIALEAAPSQAQFWLSYLDALIQSEQFETAHAVLAQGRGFEHLNTERLWRLPDIFCCYQPAPHAPAPLGGLPCQVLTPAQRVQGLPPELAAQIDPNQPVVTLGSFNNFAKVTPPVVALWSQILARLPQARLLLEIHGGQDPAFAAEVRQRFVSAGAQPTQIHILPRKPAHQYTLYHQLDLALDPFPCVGGTTSCDSLWMGVPFVTLAGEWFVGRMGVSLLNNLGMADLIAHSPAEYADKVVTLVNDLPKLAALRHGLRETMAASPLRDGPRFAAHFGAALRGMWGAGIDG